MNTKNFNLITNFQQKYFLEKNLNKKNSLVESLNKNILKSLKNENNALHILNNKIARKTRCEDKKTRYNYMFYIKFYRFRYSMFSACFKVCCTILITVCFTLFV